jgi:hypothetical protein
MFDNINIPTGVKVLLSLPSNLNPEFQHIYKGAYSSVEPTGLASLCRDQHLLQDRPARRPGASRQGVPES